MNLVGHVFNVPISKDFEHVENVLHETFTGSERRATLFATSQRTSLRRREAHSEISH